MTIGEAVGIKQNLGWGTSLIDVTASDYIGETVTITDADGNTLASKTVPSSGRIKIPVEESGNLTVSCSTATPKMAHVTHYGTYPVNMSGAVIYTLKINKNDTSPSSSCTYEDDCADFTPAGMDFDSGTFSYGSWEDAFFMPKPCMVASDGTIDYYLDPDDYSLKADGTASDIADSSYDGNAFVAIPTVWMNITTDNDYIYIHISDTQQDGYEAYAHHDQAGNIMPYTFWPIYNGSLISSTLRSLSGQTPMVSQTATSERTYAKANGSIYDIETYADRILFTMLCYLIGRSTNTQEVFGYGRCSSSNSNAISTGTMDTKGLFWGSNDGTSGVKVFGMENPWGNLWRRIVGLMASANSVYYKLTYGTEDGSSTTDYNLTMSGYISAGVAMGGTNGGYISDYTVNSWGIVAKTASGSETTYLCDGLYFTTSSGTYMAFVGGAWNAAGRVGAAYCHLAGAPSVADSYFGASLSCKPLAA